MKRVRTESAEMLAQSNAVSAGGIQSCSCGAPFRRRNRCLSRSGLPAVASACTSPPSGLPADHLGPSSLQGDPASGGDRLQQASMNANSIA